ncbi:hypothetical protein KEJ21_01570 [Candidatus Bathyarchaeota archaeon]|nr:hypothetical protein [Candidatus Bathyarchaeota archaeon]MBS7630873.1 hypothetical protein [Candidatus Bathyarchaeota archaeon]
MKSIIRASSGYATIFVTLHPNSETILKVPAAQDVTEIAPLDTIHRIGVMILDTRGDSAIRLAEEYFRHFRVGESPYGTYPVEPELLGVHVLLEARLDPEIPRAPSQRIRLWDRKRVS